MTAGTRVGPYRLVAELGRGGMAVVYRAVDTRTGGEVALKMMSADLAGAGEALARFEQEARAAYGSTHPNVVGVHEIGRDPVRGPYIVMDLVRGHSLGDLIRAQRAGLPVDQALDVAFQIASGLDHAHGKGVLHRDVKPANILVDESGVARITDFGIAKVVAATTMTRTGQALGTPAYMSPEQAGGQRVDVGSDIYSLGVVLFELLTGTVPFEGDNSLAVLMQHVHRRPPQVSKVRPDTPDDVRKIVARCLEKSPAARYASAADLMTALRAARERLRPLPVHTRLWLQACALPTKWKRRIVWSLIVLAGLLGGGWLATRMDSEPPSTDAGMGSTATVAASPASTASDAGDPIPEQRARPLTAASAAPVRPTPSPAVRAPSPPPPVAAAPPFARPSVTPPMVAPSPHTPAPRPPSPVASTRPASLPARTQHDADGATMVLIPAGSFTMGSAHGQDEEKPSHTVSLPAFYMDEHPVTVARFRRFVQSTGFQPEGVAWDMFEPALGADGAPVVNVTWNDAVEYARWANKRLPTEAQWEKAARGTTESIWPWGNTWSPRQCNWGDFEALGGRAGAQDGHEKACRVGEMEADRGPYGTCDMGGNVSCWTSDWLQPYEGNTLPGRLYGQTYRVIRGGSWNDRSGDDCRATRRRGVRPNQAQPWLGFRTVAPAR